MHYRSAVRPRAVAFGIVGVLLLALLAGCQKAVNVGAHNACGFPIEVSIGESSPDSYAWVGLDDGERQHARMVTEAATEFVVSVRRGEADAVRHFTVLKQDLAVPPVGNDYDLDVIIEGDNCPRVEAVSADSSRADKTALPSRAPQNG